MKTIDVLPRFFFKTIRPKTKIILVVNVVIWMLLLGGIFLGQDLARSTGETVGAIDSIQQKVDSQMSDTMKDKFPLMSESDKETLNTMRFFTSHQNELLLTIFLGGVIFSFVTFLPTMTRAEKDRIPRRDTK